MDCQFCNKSLKNPGALKVHENSCKSNPNRVIRTRSPLAGQKKGNIPWNKNQKTEQPAWNKGHVGFFTGKTHSEESKLLISNAAKERGLGGYVRGSGRGKKGWYSGYFCDSSWELAYLVYHLDNGIEIKRNTEKRSYIWQETTRNYLPDFLVGDCLIEIKGYRTDQWEAKLEHNPDVVVLYKNEMKLFLDYAINTYGKDFIKLYQQGEYPAG